MSGAFVVTLTVLSSTFSTEAQPWKFGAAWASARVMYLKLATTSSAPSGSPLLNLTPVRSFTCHVVGVCIVHDVASQGS